MATKVFFFYPWMKTAVPFWAKMGLLKPGLTIAPERAVHRTNEVMGTAGTSNPFTLEIPRKGKQNFFATLPLPQTVTAALLDRKRAIDYVGGHLNPMLQLVGKESGTELGHGASHGEGVYPGRPTSGSSTTRTRRSGDKRCRPAIRRLRRCCLPSAQSRMASRIPRLWQPGAWDRSRTRGPRRATRSVWPAKKHSSACASTRR